MSYAGLLEIAYLHRIGSLSASSPHASSYGGTLIMVAGEIVDPPSSACHGSHAGGVCFDPLPYPISVFGPAVFHGFLITSRYYDKRSYITNSVADDIDTMLFVHNLRETRISKYGVYIHREFVPAEQCSPLKVSDPVCSTVVPNMEDVSSEGASIPWCGMIKILLTYLPEQLPPRRFLVKTPALRSL